MATLGIPLAAFLTFDNAQAKELHLEYNLNLEDTKKLFEKKRTPELMFQWFILKLCSFSILAENGLKIMELMQRYRLSWVSNWVMKKTFFKQFCAGEDLPQTLQAVDKLYSNGMSSILDFSVGS